MRNDATVCKASDLIEHLDLEITAYRCMRVIDGNVEREVSRPREVFRKESWSPWITTAQVDRSSRQATRDVEMSP